VVKICLLCLDFFLYHKELHDGTKGAVGPGQGQGGFLLKTFPSRPHRLKPGRLKSLIDDTFFSNKTLKFRFARGRD
jgi:hypothetical protein